MRLIDADVLIDDIRKNSESYFADDFAHEWVDKQPTIEPERKTGHWIVLKDASCKTYGECSACHYKQYAGLLKYCPECGALMTHEIPTHCGPKEVKGGTE